jgi:tRNA-dihydrouridine synthase 3
LVNGLVKNKRNIPVTVKVRLGCEADTINIDEIVRELHNAGAAAITVHGRTAQQGYSKPADWDLIEQVVYQSNVEGFGHIPIIGNGDILTHFEARRRIEESKVDSVMVGRGALTKPWIFKEFKDNQTWDPDIYERISIYRTLTNYMKDHFGDDELGHKKSKNFLPWHFEFFARYTPYPEAEYKSESLESPLIQKRVKASDQIPPLDTLMINRSSDAHGLIANALWDSTSDADAILKLSNVAESIEFKHILEEGYLIDCEDQVLTNLPKGKAGKWEKRRGRKPGPKRSEEEIASIRAARAAKKAKILAEGGIWPPP